jgi:serine/threonine protein kinase
MLEKLFHAARSLSGEARERFLEAACPKGSPMRSSLDLLLVWDAAPDSPIDNTVPFAAGELTPSTVLGRYVIREVAGVGGMGQVYRAWDTTLDREVAIKSLPADLATHPGRRARLEREAKMLAALNHPNIAVIHDFVEYEGRQFLVMEFVAGPTLAEVLARGPLQSQDALGIASQIALALEAAHQSSIIHRDLKPRNIKMTTGGIVKVLDFGLATALQERPDLTALPDGALPETIGLSGTPSYMSPEQASGRPVDERTDIWAFGCIFYEMLSGRKAFPGTSITLTLTAVRQGALNWSALPGDSRPTLLTLLRRCLEKAPAHRIPNCGELRRELAALEQETKDATRWINRFRWKGDFQLPLGYLQARLLFVLTQVPYVISYLLVFYHWDHPDLEEALARAFPALPLEVTLPAIRLISLVGLAIRVYFFSLVGWKHHLAAHRFSQVFPALLVLDSVWAATPLLISHRVTSVVSLTGVVLMAWLLFGQRTAMLSLDRESNAGKQREKGLGVGTGI